MLGGIEVARRVRSEGLGARVIVLSGTTDDEDVAEAVLAGADGYLLKNDTARDLADAISCVRDGGQYSPPHLRAADVSAENRTSRAERRSMRPASDLERLRLAADSVRPTPGPGSDSSRISGRVGVAIPDIMAVLPEMIDEAVNERFGTMAERLHAEIDEQYAPMRETFAGNIQAKLVRRISALEKRAREHVEAMGELLESCRRTEENLSRLISSVNRLSTELPKPPVAKLQAGPSESTRNVARTGGANEAAAVVLILLVGGYRIHVKRAGRVAQSRGTSSEVQAMAEKSAGNASSTAAAAVVNVQANIDAAKLYMDGRKFNAAEDIFRQIVETEPANVDALKGLAAAIYRGVDWTKARRCLVGYRRTEALRGAGRLAQSDLPDSARAMRK